jgi:branched-chain amino acid transport system permease protein
MRLGAMVVGILGGLSALGIGVFGYLLGSLVTAGGGDAGGALKAISIIVPAMGIVGGAIVMTTPLLGGALLLLSALALLALLGFNAFTMASVLLLAIGAGLALFTVDLGHPRVSPSLRTPWFWGFSRAQGYGLIAMVVLIIVAPYVLYPVFLMRVLCMALFALAFNLMIGYVGLLSFGHAAFFGMGSYIAAWTMKFWHVDAALAIALGGVTGGVLGLCLGYLAIRRAGIYFAMITLALAQMVYFFCLEAPFTGGEDGIQQVPRGHLFGVISLADDMTMYWLVAAVFIGGFLMIHRIIHSPFGQVLKGIRENEPRATSLGYRTNDYKLIAFILSATLAGVACGSKALVFGIATLTDVNYPTSGEVVLTTLLGGLGTVFGPVMGAVVVSTMENYLAQFGAWVTVTQGVVFMICVLAFRRGIIGEIGGYLRLGL